MWTQNYHFILYIINVEYWISLPTFFLGNMGKGIYLIIYIHSQKFPIIRCTSWDSRQMELSLETVQVYYMYIECQMTYYLTIKTVRLIDSPSCLFFMFQTEVTHHMKYFPVHVSTFQCLHLSRHGYE